MFSAYYSFYSTTSYLWAPQNDYTSVPRWVFFLKVGVGLVPKRGWLLTLAYYAFPR
jgi:hypothetical protein